MSQSLTGGARLRVSTHRKRPVLRPVLSVHKDKARSSKDSVRPEVLVSDALFPLGGTNWKHLWVSELGEGGIFKKQVGGAT